VKKRLEVFISGYQETVEHLYSDDSDGCAKDRRALIRSGYLTMLAQYITAGAFFTAMLIEMGADETYIGYVTMATTLCMAMQFFAPLFWERRQLRKRLIVWMEAISSFLTYLGLPLVVILPIATPWKLGLYMALTLISGLLSQFCLPASNVWIMQIVPLAKRVSYESLTSMVHTVINVVSVFLAGWLVDGIEGCSQTFGSISSSMLAILILRGIAFTAAFISIICRALRVREFSYPVTSEKHIRLSMLLEPIRNRPFLCLIMIPCLWTMIGGIIGNYFSLHLIKNVEMSYTVISFAGFISTPMILLMTPIWTKVLRRKDWIRTIAWAMLGYCVAYCCNVLISAHTQFFYFIAIIVGHLFSPAITMVSNNLIFVYMPKENRTAYFAFRSLMLTASGFLGQAFGTWFVGATEAVQLDLFGISVGNLQLTSALAAILGVVLAGSIFLFRSRLPKITDDL